MHQNDLLAAAVEANVPLLLTGVPGIAKTAIVTQLAKQTGRHLEVVIGSVREPTDVAGFPFDADGITGYTVPPWLHRLNEADSGLLFLDELTTCPRATRATMLRGVQERVFGDVTLNPNVSIVAAANPPDQAANGSALSPAMANRFFHVNWGPDVEGWLDGLMNDFNSVMDFDIANPDDLDRAQIKGIVSGFIKSHHGMLVDLPERYDQREQGWPSMRSWHNLTLLWPYLHTDSGKRQGVDGLVGKAVGTEFYGYWRKIVEKIPSTEEVLDQGLDSDRQVDQLFAITSSLVSYALHNAEKKGKFKASSETEVGRRAWEVLAALADDGHIGVAWVAMRALYARGEGIDPPDSCAATFIEARDKSLGGT